MNDGTEIEPEPDAGRPLSEEVGPDTGRLQDYAKLKHATARAIRSIRSLTSEVKDERVAAEAQELMSKLAEDRFTLAVVGQFKRGKSSLMNAIIGRDLLPTGMLPLTSAITILKYGPTERLTILRDRDSIFPERPPVSSLAAYVTEQGNPGNQKGVKAAVLEMPSPFLRRGLEFVDTPGIGSAIVANTETTYAFLPQCDAVVFVTSVDSPLTEAEVDFLRSVRQFAQEVFFVVNKTDLLEGADREQVIAFVSDRLHAETGGESLRIYPLSANRGMAAKSSADSAAYASSGLKEFEEALGKFLAVEKTSAFLASVLVRAVRLTDELSPGIPAGALSVRCVQIGNRLRTLRHTVSPGTAPEPRVSVQDASAWIAEAERSTSGVHHEWTPALKARGCPVCAEMADAAFDFYARWQHTLIADESAQDQFTAGMGFCSLHTWQFAAISSPQGLSSTYSKLAEQCGQKLSQFAVAPDAASRNLETILPGRRQCPACRKLRAVEEAAIHSLTDFLKDATALRVYHDSQGVCLRHLAHLIRASGNSDLARRLLQHASRRFGEMAEDMQNYALKHDGVRRALQNEDEKDAYLRAIVRLVGGRAICAPWEEDVEI
jgi:GTP-binding protein EngB required for normal cell division